MDMVIELDVLDIDIPAPAKNEISADPDVLLCNIGPVRKVSDPSLLAVASVALTVIADDVIDEKLIPVPALRLTVLAPATPSTPADDDDPAQDSVGVVLLMVILLAG